MSTAARAGLAMLGLATLVIGGLWLHSAPSRQGDPDAGLPATAHRPAMRPVPSGAFIMGSPADEAGRYASESVRSIRLTHGFWMAETEITQDQYAATMGHNPSRFRGAPGDGRRPVETVSWFDAVRYCNALSTIEGLGRAYLIDGDSVTWDRDAPGYRLPTAAEWEYAARAGTRTATYVGDLTLRGRVDAPELHAIAWFATNSASDHPEAYAPAAHMLVEGWTTALSTQPVRGKRPNRWGLYDMLGNVLEWVWNRTGPPIEDTQARPLVDPEGPADGVGRVIRGGAFRDAARGVRAAVRGGGVPEGGHDVIGFRPVRTMPSER